MLTEGEYASRTATILADYMEVMGGAKRNKDELVVDGTKLFGIIESLVRLMTDMEPQMTWPKAPKGLPYN